MGGWGHPQNAREIRIPSDCGVTMKATVQWKENMTFLGMPDSGFPVQMDADSYFGGTNQGVRPMEMIALGLAGCTGMDVISILRKKRQQVSQFEVRVNAPLGRASESVHEGVDHVCCDRFPCGGSCHPTCHRTVHDKVLSCTGYACLCISYGVAL